MPSSFRKSSKEEPLLGFSGIVFILACESRHEREQDRTRALSRPTARGQSTACPLIEIDHRVEVGVDALGERAEGGELLAVLLQEAGPVRVGSPLRIVDDTGAVCASVQRRPDHAGLILHRLGEANPLLDQRLLLLILSPLQKCQLERSEEHTSELQSHLNLVCRLLLEKKKRVTKQSE